MSVTDPTDPTKAIHIKFTNFPQNLLVSSLDNVLSFESTNYFNQDVKFKFDFEGENLDIKFPDELESEIKFSANETKEFNLKLNPTTDGFGKLSMVIYWLKVVQYTVKVKKVRDKIPQSRIDEILDKYIMKSSETFDSFNPLDYLDTRNKIKQLEKQLEVNRKKFNEYPLLRKAWEEKQLQGITSPEPIREVSLKELDNDIQQLAKAYLADKNLIKALELALQVSDEVNEVKKIDFYYNLIRAYAFIDLDNAIQILKTITADEKKYNLIKKIALDQLKSDPEKAPRVAFLIDAPSVKKGLITELILKTIKINPEIAIKISQLIEEEELLRVKILLNIVREFHNKGNKSQVISLLHQIIKIMEDSKKIAFSEKDFKNLAYKYYSDLMYLLAEVDSPKAVDTLILDFKLRELKDKIAEDMFDVIYKMVDEIRTKFEPVLVFSQYYLFNILATKVNEHTKNFSLNGGNISSNILLNEKINLFLLSLFSYDFTIFPMIDRVYSDLKFNLQKSIGYYIYPSKENHNESELLTINNTLSQFISSNLANNPNPVLIYNLDFIPYLGKPTIITSQEPQLFENFQARIKKTLGDAVNIINDDSLFKGGSVLDNLNQNITSNNCKITNLVLSYEFINDYNIFKNFILSLV